MLKIDGSTSANFLAGGGEMGALTRAYRWVDSPLGAPETWPQSLRTAVRLLLNNGHPMLLWWGPQLIQFYNDAYRQIMEPELHPAALGQRCSECWEEIWDILGPQIEHVVATGEGTSHENLLLPTTDRGKLRQRSCTYSYSPVDHDGRIGGVLVVCRDIARERRATDALRQRETELARVQEIGRISGLDLDLRTGRHNRRSLEYLLIHGLSAETADESREDWIRRIHPEDRATAEKKFREAVAGRGRDYMAQYRIIRPSDGEIRWISVRSTIERDRSGKAMRLVGAYADVTEQVVAEQALRQSETEFRTLADALPHHVWTAKPAGLLNWFNPRVYEYAGSASGELDGNKWTRIVHPDDIPNAVAAWTQAIGSGEAYEVEFRLRRADGAFRWFLARAVPARDERGEIIRWIGTNTDVHDHKLIAEELAELNATLAQRVEEKTRERDRIWNVSQDLLVVADHDGVWRTVNPAWAKTLGWSEAELLGRTPEWLQHPDDEGIMRAQVDKLGEAEATVRFESRFRHKDGSYCWLSWTGVSDHDHIYAVARDITADKAAAERLKATEEALLQFQKMEAVGQLTGGIAHDFNNLLTGIVGSLDLLQTRLGQGRTENVARYVDAAMTSANRAAALTHRLLAFARRQPLIPKIVDADRLVGSLEDLLRRTIGETIDLVIVASEDLWCTLCDPNQLESALLNLAINARDAMPDGGTLTIATANARLDGVQADPALAPGDYICISVADSGTGMSAEVAARAFDPFFTTKPIGQGTGLGLSMIYGFARQSNGHVIIDSKLGEGTSVRLYLPRHHGKTPTQYEQASRAGEPAIAGETVLVVEDEPVVRGVILEMLAEQGYRTHEAVDGPSGLRILHSAERIDLLVTDVGLPGMNGRQLADQARKDRPALKILFITGYAESVAISDGFLQPGMEMITKPFDLGNLSRCVRAMVSS